MPPRRQNNEATNELKKITAEYKKLLGEIKKMTAAIAKAGPGKGQQDMKKVLQDLKAQSTMYQEYLATVEDANRALKESTDWSTKYKKNLDDILKGSKSILDVEEAHGDLSKDLVDSQKTLRSFYNGNYDILSKTQRDQVSTLKHRIAQQKKNVKGQEFEFDLRKKQIDGARTQLKLAEDYGLQLVESANKFVKSFPGGEFMSQALGLDSLGKNFQKAFNQGIAKFLQTGSVGQAAGTFAGHLKVGSIYAVALAAAIAASVALLAKLEKSAKELAKQTGISRNQAFELEKSIRGRTYSEANSLASNKEIANLIGIQVAEFGRLGMMSADTAANTVQIGEAFGYGEETAGQVAAQLMSIGGLTAEAALDMQTFGAAMAEAEGVAPGKVMKDIAQNSKSMAKFMGGNAKLMMKTAIEAAKLGMSIADMAKVAEGLLDIESSLSSQYEAQALLGRTLNFDRARQLALEGNIAGATAEILDQAGSYKDLSDMTYLQRKKLAEAAGLEVDQLMKAAKLQEVTAGMSEEQRKQVEATGLSMAQLNNMSREQILAQASANAEVEKMEGMWEEISNILINTILPPVIQIVKLFATVLAPILKVIGALLYGILLPIMLIGEGIAAIVEWVQQFEAVTSVIKFLWDGLVFILQGVAVVLGFLVGIVTILAIAAIWFNSATTLGIGMIAAGLAAAVGIASLASDKASGKQMGGSVTAGVPYTVGESGREIFTPATNGHITSNAEVKRNEKGGSSSQGVITAINNLSAKLDALVARPANIVIDGRTVQTITNAQATMDTYKVKA